VKDGDTTVSLAAYISWSLH